MATISVDEVAGAARVQPDPGIVKCAFLRPDGAIAVEHLQRVSWPCLPGAGERAPHKPGCPRNPERRVEAF